MPSIGRKQRLIADLATLRKLQDVSTIFSFTAEGEPPNRYTLTFNGRGVIRDFSSQATVTFADRHQVELRLSSIYPEGPPDVRWLTPIFHPNVSFSGFIRPADIGIPWTSAATLDVVCEQLWEVARDAYVNPDKVVNFPAKEWFETQTDVVLPVDPRPLRDAAIPAAHNVVKYERRRGTSSHADPGDVFYIGDDSPSPPALPPSLPRPNVNRSDDVLYIGDE